MSSMPRPSPKPSALKVTESRESSQGDFAELTELTATVRLLGECGRHVLRQHAAHREGQWPHVGKRNARGVIFLLENRDRPGIVAMWHSPRPSTR